LTTRPKGGVSGEGGMSTTIVATLYLVVFTMVLATPIGVGAAIYLTEYAADAARRSRLLARLIRLARTGVEILAGVPSIIYGLFGFALFVVALNTFTGGFSILSASLAGACMVLPVIIRTSEEALLAVPRSYREGSLALGATKWQTITQVVLPAAPECGPHRGRDGHLLGDHRRQLPPADGHQVGGAAHGPARVHAGYRDPGL